MAETYINTRKKNYSLSLNPLTLVPPVTGRDEPWLFFHFWRHHFWPKYSTSAGGKDLSNDAQIRVIGLMEPEICTNILKKLSEKLTAKFRATTPGCSMVKIARLVDALLEVFYRKQAQYWGQPLQQKEKNRRKRKLRRKKDSKLEKPKGVGHRRFLVQNFALARDQLWKNAF